MLVERDAAPFDVLRDFLLQCVWCMFAEDLGQLEAHSFSRIVHGLIENQSRSSADDLGQLFVHLNTPGTRPAHGMYANTPYANGGLFEEPAAVHLVAEELDALRYVTEFNWRQVEPQIFGSLLEAGLGREKQWKLGAHFTHEVDIQKVVQPTIVEPWREKIENASTHAQAKALQAELMHYVVLDPACGSGNFLYVAYRELRRLEKRLSEREAELRRGAGMSEQGAISLFFPLSNIRGIEIDGFAVALARVTLWMGHKLAVDELSLPEPTLPLADLSGIRVDDALRVPWPRAQAIIGNPPFHGSQNLRRVMGDEYVEWLRSEFGVGVKDYCVYWFRRAHDALRPGERAGLVGTNSISQNRARGVSLEYLLENGGVITNAVSKQVWPGEAVVNVSIVNWVKEPGENVGPMMLDGREVANIDASLRSADDRGREPVRLRANRRRAFQGPMPVGRGFVIAVDEAHQLTARVDADYRIVVRPYLIGEDIANDPRQAPSRFVIDFAYLSLEDAMRYPAALSILEERVKPERQQNRDRFRREHWWLLGRPVLSMRAAIAPLRRYMAGTRVGKRVLFCWCEPWWSPSDATNVFAFDDDYSMGVLCSQAHTAWAWLQSSTMRVDIRYTPTSAFETFPWPQPDDAGRAAVAGACVAMIERRREICAQEEIGLTELYNRVDDGAYADLATLQRALDEAVAGAYGWPRSIAQDPAELTSRLLDLNAAIASGEVEYSPFP